MMQLFSLIHHALTPGWVLAEMLSIFGILQLAKQTGLAAFLNGRAGVAFNVVVAFLGTFAVAQNIAPQTWMTAIVVALGAAGIHANAKVVTGGTVGASGLSASAAAQAVSAQAVKKP